MGAFRNAYSQEIRKVEAHANRLVRVLEPLEARAPRGASILGISGMASLLLGRTLTQWRSGSLGAMQALDRMVADLDEAHRMAGRALGTRPLFACCGEDDAITEVPSAPADEIPVLPASRPAGGEGNAQGADNEPSDTVVDGWVEAPGVEARLREGQPLVDRMARALARQLGTNVVTLDDLGSFAREGLLLAARSFDATRGRPFASWAGRRMRGAMIDGVRSWSGLPRGVREKLRMLETLGWGEETPGLRPGPAAADARLQSRLGALATTLAIGVAADDSGGGLASSGLSAEDAVARRELVRVLDASLAKLPSVDRELVTRYFFREQTVQEAGAAVGLSKGRASQRLSAAVETLGRHLREAHVDAAAVRQALSKSSVSRAPAASRRPSPNDSTVG